MYDVCICLHVIQQVDKLNLSFSVWLFASAFPRTPNFNVDTENRKNKNGRFNIEIGGRGWEDPGRMAPRETEVKFIK